MSDANKKSAKVVDDKTVTLDGVDYLVKDLSEDAKRQIFNVRATDQEIARLNLQLAIAQTARASYAAALTQYLPKPKSAAKAKN